MSTLKVNTVQHITSGFNNVVQFTDGSGTQNGTLCRAWVRFNGTGAISINGSFNVSSITDVGTGHYRVNWANNFPNVNYCSLVCGTGGQTSSGYVQHDSDQFGGQGVNTPAVGSISLRATNSSGSNVDHEWVTAAAFN
jgi:hypothetical protein